MVKKQYDEMKLKIQEGEIVTLKKGTIGQSPITKEWYTYKKFKYLGNGGVEVIGEKEPVNVRQKTDR